METQRHVRWVLWYGLLLSFAGSHAQASPKDEPQKDLSQISFENLLDLEVFSASKYKQKVNEAPSAVTVVTADEIKAYGWVSLAEILRSIRGLYTTYDRLYQYLGSRGFSRSGDYNSRYLLQIDGSRTNDPMFDASNLGTEFLIDVSMIDRVEFIPGPGASIYGSNALFGVINVITKNGRHFKGGQVSAEAGSAGRKSAQFNYGTGGEHGDWLVSATSTSKTGKDMYFPEFDSPATNNGVAEGLDFEHAKYLFVKHENKNLDFTFAHAERKRGLPTAAFSTVFNEWGEGAELQTFAKVGYRHRTSDSNELSLSVYAGRYDLDTTLPIDLPPVVINYEKDRARWYGYELRSLNTSIEGHKILVGLEQTFGVQIDQRNYNLEPSYTEYLNNQHANKKSGLYIQDDFTWGEHLRFNVGLRYDKSNITEGIFSPRVGAIYKAAPTVTLKVLIGQAYRAPNDYEAHHAVPGQAAGVNLSPERIKTKELMLEKIFEQNGRLQVSLFQNTVQNIITQFSDPVTLNTYFQNTDEVNARGADVSYEKIWSEGTRLRTSYSFHRAKDGRTGGRLANSPIHLFKMNWMTPLPVKDWSAGFESLYTSKRKTIRNTSLAPAYWLTNLTLVNRRFMRNTELSLGLYNLFDRKYGDPAGEENVQNTIPQDGRTFRLKLTYNF